MMSQDVAELVKSMLAGEKTSLAHLISLIERESPVVPKIMELVAPFLHHAYRIGITGLAGAGKSTLIDGLTTIFRSKGLAVGIVAVDPSSAITGGAVLGDRIRMQQHYLDEGVFIRSMATRGSCGGLSKAVADTLKLLDASGKDVILIETTGVGQTDTDVTGVADVVVVVLVPGFGDSIQLMKAGLIEIADVIVVNKADREGADTLVNDLKDALSYSLRKADRAIVVTQANSNIGIDELYRELEKRRKLAKTSHAAQT